MFYMLTIGKQTFLRQYLAKINMPCNKTFESVQDLLKKHNIQCMTEHIILTLTDLNCVEPNILK